MTTKRRENTGALHNIGRWIERESTDESAPDGISLSRVKQLADPDAVQLVQAVILHEDIPESETPRRLYVGYNLDGRAVRVVNANEEPTEFKYLPHLFFVTVTPKDFFGLRAMAEKDGTLVSSD